MAKSSLVPTKPSSPAEQLAAEFVGMPTEELRRELAQQMKLTAGHILRLAMIVRALEERGEDLSDLKAGMLDYLRLVAHGQLLPEIVARYADMPMLISRMSAMPLPDQQRIADGEPVKLIVMDAAGQITHRLMQPEKLARDQVTQVFGRNSLHDDQEQVAIIESRRTRPPKDRRIVQVGRIKADRERNGIVVGRQFIPVGQVLEALAALRPRTVPDDGEQRPVVAKVSREEHARIEAAAARADCSMSDIVKRALWAAGLLAE